jgi:hypothetical protein|tara:strand:+ start:85 stop:246 length:162 start_codon:yes stop_codon:yes gene_type:complete
MPTAKVNKKAATEKLRSQVLLKKAQALEAKKKKSFKDATRLHNLRTRKIPKDV